MPRVKCVAIAFFPFGETAHAAVFAQGIKAVSSGQKVVKKIQNVKNGLKQLVIPGMFFEDMGVTYLGPVDH